MDLPRKIANEKGETWDKDEDDQGKPPFEIEQKANPPEEAKPVANRVNDGPRKEPSEPLNIGGEARHEVSCLVFVEERFRKMKGSFEEIVLDVEKNPLFEAREVKLLEQTHEPFREPNSNKKQNGSCEKDDLPVENHPIDEVPENHGLRKGEDGCDENEDRTEEPFSPMPRREGPKVLEVGGRIGVSLSAGDALFGEFSREPAFQISNPAIGCLRSNVLNARPPFRVSGHI